MGFGPPCKASLVLQQYLCAPTSKARWWKNLLEGTTGEHTVPWCSGVTALKAVSPLSLQCMSEYFIQSREMEAGKREKKQMQNIMKCLHPPRQRGAVDNTRDFVVSKT